MGLGHKKGRKMTIVGTALAALGLAVCLLVAAVSIRTLVTGNSNVEIRSKLIGSIFLFISVAIGIGMVLLIARIPSGAYLGAVGIPVLASIGVLLKFGRK